MKRLWLGITVTVIIVTAAGIAGAHITPPVVLMSDRDALIALLAGAQKFFVREVRLSDDERREVEKRTGWKPDEDFYRFFLGRDAGGQLVAATLFLSDYTVHGPVRIATAFDSRGNVKGVRVVEVTEETYSWVQPLIDRDFTRPFVGHPASHAAYQDAKGPDVMSHFYAQVVAGLVRRAGALYETTIMKKPA
jgi:hypothetical protein